VGIVPENLAFTFWSGLTPNAIDPIKSIIVVNIIIALAIDLVLDILSPMDQVFYYLIFFASF
jgi:hypothetical protein